METPLATEVFDHFDKTYLLDRLAGTGSGPVVRITEMVHDGIRRGRYSVELDASVLARVLAFMEAPVFRNELGRPVGLRRHLRLSSKQKTKLVQGYLKGVSSEDLAIRFGCKGVDIEELLRVEGIAIVDQTPPKPKKWKGNWRYRG